MKFKLLIALLALTGILYFWLFSAPSVLQTPLAADSSSIERGRYLVHAGGCISCHTNANGNLSGGMALDSPFGIFYASNITPDPMTGIGGWQGNDFIRALKHGRTPTGSFYYPAFPYRSYAGISDQDALDIGAYLMAQPAVVNDVAAHELDAWVARWQMAGWNKLADLSEPRFANLSDPQLARGAYLTRHLGHCSECHTPRNSLGILRFSQEFAGGVIDNEFVQAIDAEALTNWGEEDLALFLFIGLKPDGEYVGGKMDPVIEHNTGQLTDEDRQAMAAFFKRGL